MMSREDFIKHAKLAGENYRRYLALQARIDKFEADAIAARGGQAWAAMLDIRNLPQYKIMITDRNVALQRAGVECGMAQLYASGNW